MSADAREQLLRKALELAVRRQERIAAEIELAESELAGARCDLEDARRDVAELVAELGQVSPDGAACAARSAAITSA